MKKLLNLFISTFFKSKVEFDETERRLHAIQKDILDYVTCIDMGQSNGSTNMLITKNWSEPIPGIRHAESRLPTKTCTSLNSIIEQGVTMPRHFHKDQSEEIFVVEGEITDLDTGVTIKEGDVYSIEAGRPHTIKADKNTLLNIVCRPKFSLFNKKVRNEFFNFTEAPQHAHS